MPPTVRPLNQCEREICVSDWQETPSYWLLGVQETPSYWFLGVQWPYIALFGSTRPEAEDINMQF